MFYAVLTSENAAQLLSTLGAETSPAAIVLERREDRWLIRLPENRIAWIAASEHGHRLLERDRRLLRFLAARCSIEVPRIIAESADGAADIRSLVVGAADPVHVCQTVLRDPAVAARLGRSLGLALAELHSSAESSDIAEWLPDRLEWPHSRDRVMDCLRSVINDSALHARAERVLARYEAQASSVTPRERTLVHGDLGFHNIAVEPATLELRGIFDWESAIWSDPHLDFRYLLADLQDSTLFEAARSAYATVCGRSIDPQRVVLYNAVWAVSYLAYRVGVAPETRWCGRTLEEDLSWTRRALDRALEAKPGA